MLGVAQVCVQFRFQAALDHRLGQLLELYCTVPCRNGSFGMSALPEELMNSCIRNLSHVLLRVQK
jgi:hypothetical protein